MHGNLNNDRGLSSAVKVGYALYDEFSGAPLCQVVYGGPVNFDKIHL